MAPAFSRNSAPGATSVSYDSTTRTARFTLPAALADGDYRATLPAGSVQGFGGVPLSPDQEVDFFTLAGDVTRDRRVNLEDFNVLAANFGQSNRTFTQGDLDYDGRVNLNDFTLLAGRFGRTLAAATTGGTTSSVFGEQTDEEGELLT